MRVSTGRLFAVALAAAFASGPAVAAGKKDLNFGSGNQGGSQYPVTVAIGQVLEKVPEIGKVTIQPGGSVGNIVRVDEGKSDIAISMSMSLLDGRLGNKPFKKKTENVLNLFTLHAFHVVVFVPEESPIKTLKDFAGKKVNIAPKGYSVREVGEDLLSMVGVKDKVNIGSLRIVEGVEAFKDGHYDGLLYAASTRMGPFINLAQTRKVRLVPIDKPLLDAYVKKHPSFYLSTFPKSKGVYKNLSNSVETLSYPNVIVASTKLGSDTAYAIVKAVAEQFDAIRSSEPSLADFDPKEMAQMVGTPFHPGAVKYYKEKGIALNPKTMM